MPSIHVCSLSRVEATVAASGASHLVTLLHTPVKRPRSIAAERHLFIGIADIVGPIRGMTEPAERHVHQLLAFVGAWDRTKPMVMHCFAGISRSTAGAFIALCHLLPDRPEAEVAQRLRDASPVASPNPRMVELADRIMGRDGRMVEAVNAIGLGALAFEADPFALPIRDIG
jgi:predicted protein tyrosine phosphatase